MMSIQRDNMENNKTINEIIKQSNDELNAFKQVATKYLADLTGVQELLLSIEHEWHTSRLCINFSYSFVEECVEYQFAWELFKNGETKKGVFRLLFICNSKNIRKPLIETSLDIKTKFIKHLPNFINAFHKCLTEQHLLLNDARN